MYTLYIANRNYSSWSLRPWVLMRELAIAFTEVVIPFGGTTGGRALRDVSPTARVPCLHDGALVVWDSLAIVEYLAERHAGVWPADATARAWARCAAAEMHSGYGALRERCTMNCGLRIRLHEFPPALAADVARLEALWTQGLAWFGGPFLAGERFTAADAFFAPVAFRVQTYDLPLSAASRAYAQRLLDLPSMQAWLAAALREPWRDEAHELEARALGDWLVDQRVAPGRGSDPA